jgi:hypothetical protein
MKEGGLVCFVLYVLGVFGKLSMRRGAWAWFHGIWSCGAKVLEY